jgi:predicted Zn-ribbon and HTH transcriptional regulator
MPESTEDRQSELESLWYEIAQAIAAGRTQGLVCPECLSEGLEVEEQRGRTSVRCPNCKRFVEVGIATA